MRAIYVQKYEFTLWELCTLTCGLYATPHMIGKLNWNTNADEMKIESALTNIAAPTNITTTTVN